MIKLFELLGEIWITVFVIMVVVGGGRWLWHFFKCQGIKGCNNRKCKFRNYCFRYDEKITEEEVKNLLQLIDKL